MPLPTPNKGEKKDDFLDRCMGNETMKKEYPDKDQRYAVCNSQWDKKDKSQSLGHVLNAIQGSHWAITREMLETIHQVVVTHTEGKEIDIPAIEAQLGRKLENSYSVEVKDGVAVIPIDGVISKRMNLFSMISGGTSTEILMHDFKAALEDDEVKSILLDVDSPGGTVDGTKALVDLIYESRGTKPIIAFANGLMASAAYWIGSAADQIITEPTASVGSIGVIAMHKDYSKQDEMLGVKRTIISSGKYKAIGNDAEPLSKEGREYLQERLDYIYSIFVDEVARNRGVDKKTALKNMADGKVFIGQQAVDAGLVDQTGNFEDAFMIAKNKSEGGGGEGKAKTNVNQLSTIKKGGEDSMNVSDLKKKDPEGYAALLEEARGDIRIEYDKERDQLKAEHEKVVTDLKGQIKDKDDQIQSMSDRVGALEKKDVIREENARQEQAERIFDAKLGESDIPSHLHPKVKAQISYAKFVSEEGNFDTQAFADAIDKEIADGWPIEKTIIGGAHTRKEIDGESVSVQEKEDDAAVDKMIELSGYAGEKN